MASTFCLCIGHSDGGATWGLCIGHSAGGWAEVSMVAWDGGSSEVATDGDDGISEVSMEA